MTVLSTADKVPIHDFDRQGLGPVSLRKWILESTRLLSASVTL